MKMTNNQLQSAYYAFYRAEVNYRAFIQLRETEPITSYHDLLSSPAGAYLYVWHGLLFAVLEFLQKFDDGIPVTINSEVQLFYGPLKKFRNAIFHIQNHPFSQKQDDIIKIPKALTRVEVIHYEVGKYVCGAFGYPYPASLPGAPSENVKGFMVPFITPTKKN